MRWRVGAMCLAAALALSATSPMAGPRAGEAARDDGGRALPLLPGIGAHDPRRRVDPNEGPWRAVGKLQAVSPNLRQTCTATLVASAVVLTAAHCVFNERTGRVFAPGSIHFLVGFAGGEHAGHAAGTAIKTGPGYDPQRPRQTMGGDWALISLDRPLGAAGRILPLFEGTPEIGSPVTLGGYQQDHPLLLLADAGCHVRGRVADPTGHVLLRHDCAGSRGVSGAPLLTQKDGRWFVAGIDVAAEAEAVGGLAVFLDEARRSF
jgi:protease YdgD